MNSIIESLKKCSKKKLILAPLGIILGLLIAVGLTPPELLEEAAVANETTGRLAMVVLGSLVWAICWWVGTVMPDWATAVGMMIIWTLAGCCPFGVAFSQYSGGIVWLLIGAFAVSGAVLKTGALRRISLLMMKVFPPTFRGQVLAQMLVGTIITPLIPSSTAKAVLGANMSSSTAKAMKYPAFSKGATGIFMSGYTGFALGVPAFLSAGAICYVILGALPEDVQANVSWGSWTIAMLPWLAIMLVGMYFIITKLYKPETESQMTKEHVGEELKAMGKLGGKELASMIVMFGCLILWIFEKQLGVPAALTALIGGILVFLFGILEPKEVGTRIAWPLILFIGGVIQLGNMFSSMGINQWLRGVLGPMFAALDNKFLLVIAIFVAVVIVRFAVASLGACALLFIAILTPLVQPLGMSPFILGTIIYVAQQIWFMPYQNTTYAPAIGAVDGYVNHKDVAKACPLYCAVALAGCLISIPYWSLLGYM